MWRRNSALAIRSNPQLPHEIEVPRLRSGPADCWVPSATSPLRPRLSNSSSSSFFNGRSSGNRMTSRIERESVKQHRQSIDADAFAGGRRQSIRQRANVVLVHLMGFFVAAGALAQLLLEAPPLLFGIVQFAEGIADLQPAHEDLEALHPVGILFRLALVLGQRRDGQRKVVDERRLDRGAARPRTRRSPRWSCRRARPDRTGCANSPRYSDAPWRRFARAWRNRPSPVCRPRSPART